MARTVGIGHAETMDTTRNPRDRTLVVLLSAIGALVVFALAVVLTRGEPEALDPSSPEGVVQAYAKLVIEGDELGAMEYLTDDAAENCVDSGYRNTSDIRVRLVSVDERQGSADVRVTIIETYSDGLGGGEYQSEEVFDLVDVDGQWRISYAPWQLMVCPNKEVGS